MYQNKGRLQNLPSSHFRSHKLLDLLAGGRSARVLAGAPRAGGAVDQEGAALQQRLISRSNWKHKTKQCGMEAMAS
jgi:hypothetical protein